MGPQPDLSSEIDLASTVERPRKYAASTAFAVRYDAKSVPDDEILRRDLGRMLELRTSATEAGLDFGAVEPLHLVLKWSPDREPRTIELAREAADQHGSMWWASPGGAGSGISESQIRGLQEQLAKHPGVTRAFLYRRGECWRAGVAEATTNLGEVEQDLMPAVSDPAEHGLFLRLTDLQQVDSDWPLTHLVPANNVSTEATAEALGNQRTPLLVYERFVPAADTGAEVVSAAGAELTMEWLAEETLLPTPVLQAIVESLQGSSPQVILAGPPGTSKTWVAERIARYVTGDNPLCTRTVQFHPSYGYEEFIEGLRPVAAGGGIAFERVNGIVLDMAQQIEDEEHWHVLVIDEMNRANLPRVLGELMYLFEYRDKPLNLAYTKDFSLPHNLLFIGTMNTADRSIRGIDIALRRRFEVFELSPDPGVLGRFYDNQRRVNDVPDLVEGFVALNAELRASLDRHHTIGHSFFMTEHMTVDRLTAVWDRKIAPLIEEYFFDQPYLAEEFRMARFWPGAQDANHHDH